MHERDLMQRAVTDPAILDRSVAEVMGPPLPSVGSGETVDVGRAAPRGVAGGDSCSTTGTRSGCITRSDALAFLAQAGAAREGR